jgi:hypothetical protein
MRPVITTIAALVALTAPNPAFAWGNEGHEIIAAIARGEMTPHAVAWVDAILATDADTLTAPDMASRATWADRWRDSGHRETAEWHFVDQELVKPDIKSACFGEPKPSDPPSAGPAQDCIVDKINEFETELMHSNTPAERLLALKYLLHFIGDVHQPLHASDNQDRGGNCVHVLLGEHRTSNLHSFWDTGVLAPLGSDPRTVATSLAKEISPVDRARWAAGTPTAWARESYGVARSVAYTIRSRAGCESDVAPIALSDAYQAKALTAAKTQLERAGVRLAWVLNRAAAQASGV